MFESGKKQQKTAENSEEKPCLLPTHEQVLNLWDKHFKVLLKFSENHNAELLKQFESDTLKYIKDIPSPQK